MRNDEITRYMNEWVGSMKAAPSKESSIMGAVIGTTVMLAEVAKRLPEPVPVDAKYVTRDEVSRAISQCYEYGNEAICNYLFGFVLKHDFKT